MLIFTEKNGDINRTHMVCHLISHIREQPWKDPSKIGLEYPYLKLIKKLLNSWNLLMGNRKSITLLFLSRSENEGDNRIVFLIFFFKFLHNTSKISFVFLGSFEEMSWKYQKSFSGERKKIGQRSIAQATILNSRLKIKYLKYFSEENKENYSTKWNYYVKLLRKEK